LNLPDQYCEEAIMKLFLLQVGDHFCEQNDAVMMISQYATFSVGSGLPCGGSEKRVLDQAINGPPAGVTVLSLEPEKLEHLLYHPNSTRHNIKFTMETRQCCEPPSCTFVFVGDPMAVCFGRITVSHPCELLSHLWLT
jgi:hypothetical protein